MFKPVTDEERTLYLLAGYPRLLRCENEDIVCTHYRRYIIDRGNSTSVGQYCVCCAKMNWLSPQEHIESVIKRSIYNCDGRLLDHVIL